MKNIAREEILADGGQLSLPQELFMVYLLELWIGSAVNHVYELKIVLETKAMNLKIINFL